MVSMFATRELSVSFVVRVEHGCVLCSQSGAWMCPL